MEIKTKIKQLITVLLYNIKERKKMILALSCLVVFFTTYLLILPAFTLDKEEAAEQGGVDVPGVPGVPEFTLVDVVFFFPVRSITESFGESYICTCCTSMESVTVNGTVSATSNPSGAVTSVKV